MSNTSEMTDDLMLARLDRVIADLEAIRAQRWLDQYPPGHPERPAKAPEYVERYVARAHDEKIAEITNPQP